MRPAAVVRLALLSATSPLLIGCASTQRVSFISDPKGATVVVGARAVGETPVTVKLDRRGDQVLTFAKDGYKPVTARTTASDEWFGGRLDCDAVSGGSIDEYSPSRYRVTLPPDGTAPMEAKAALPQQQTEAQEPIQASPPSPAPSEWPRECSAKAAGYGKEENSYCLLMGKCRGGTREAESHMEGLDYRNKTKTVELVSRRILTAKGTVRVMSWRFTVDPALPDPEKACVAWFLRRYTAYQPVGASEGR